MAAYFGRIDIGGDGLPRDRWERSSLTSIALPFPMRLAWEPGRTIRRIKCHRAVARDLVQILAEILTDCGSLDLLQIANMDLFGGCYQFGAEGASLSMHSYGIAIDLDPRGNPAGKAWQDGMIFKRVVAIFERHGWEWGGRWEKPECGHFQAARRS